MGRHGVFDGVELPKGVMEIIRAVCADYYRRAREIKNQTKPDYVLDCYKDLNDKIDEALEEIEPNLRQDFLHDIVTHTGWHSSRAGLYGSIKWYYKRKNHCIQVIAKNLHLV